jgi:hypothetical protein
MTIASLYNFKQRPTLGAIEVNVSYSGGLHTPGGYAERSRREGLGPHRSPTHQAGDLSRSTGGSRAPLVRSRAQVNEQGEVIRRPVNGEGVEGLTVAEAYAQLFEVFNQKEPFDVVTNLRSYKDMHFVSLTITRDAQTSEVLAFSATLAADPICRGPDRDRAGGAIGRAQGGAQEKVGQESARGRGRSQPIDSTQDR